MTMSAGANWQHASSPTTELQGNDLNDSASGPYKVNSLRINPISHGERSSSTSCCSS